MCKIVLWLYVWLVFVFVLFALEGNEKPNNLDFLGVICLPVTLPYLVIKSFRKYMQTKAD